MADKMDVSSPESSGENTITTPKEQQQTIDTSALSPPDSQRRGSSNNMPLSASGSSLANSNGKRPIQTISNGSDDVEEMASMGNGGVSLNGKHNYASTKTHSSGYTWHATEDEPGYMWQSKKAQDDYKRAADQAAHKECMIRAKYGDIFEMVENERAVLASMEQR